MKLNDINVMYIQVKFYFLPLRDAACYLCWAFARAYHPEQMAPYVKQLARGLLIVALFDREVSIKI